MKRQLDHLQFSLWPILVTFLLCLADLDCFGWMRKWYQHLDENSSTSNSASSTLSSFGRVEQIWNSFETRFADFRRVGETRGHYYCQELSFFASFSWPNQPKTALHWFSLSEKTACIAKCLPDLTWNAFYLQHFFQSSICPYRDWHWCNRPNLKVQKSQQRCFHSDDNHHYYYCYLLDDSRRLQGWNPLSISQSASTIANLDDPFWSHPKSAHYGEMSQKTWPTQSTIFSTNTHDLSSWANFPDLFHWRCWLAPKRDWLQLWPPDFVAFQVYLAWWPSQLEIEKRAAIFATSFPKCSCCRSSFISDY